MTPGGWLYCRFVLQVDMAGARKDIGKRALERRQITSRSGITGWEERSAGVHAVSI